MQQNCAKAWSTSVLCACLIPDLKVCMNLSASPFELGWYGAKVSQIPFPVQNCEYSSEVNWGPLSETIWWCMPYLANSDIKTVIVLLAVVALVEIISGHFVCASTTMSHTDPSKGPMKSIWILFYGSRGSSQWWTGALVGSLEFFWHCVHLLTVSSMCISIWGHWMCILPTNFILTIPVCPVWISSNTLPRCYDNHSTQYATTLHAQLCLMVEILVYFCWKMSLV